MEPEVSRRLAEELQRLNARVARLEGFGSDLWKKTKEAAGSLMHAEGGGELSQGVVFDALREFDKDARVTGEDHFSFTLRGRPASLIWDPHSKAAPFELTCGDNVMHVDSLPKLKAYLKACNMRAPANLHEYTSAVLRQQVRPSWDRY